MRLKECRERVKSISAHKAESIGFHDEIDGDLNEALEEVWCFKHWTCRDRLVALDILPDIVGTAATPIQVANDSRYVETSGLNPLHPDRNLIVSPGRTWIGQVLTVFGRDYPILDLQLEGSDDAIILAEPIRLRAGDNPVDVTDYTLKFVRLRLPDDCVEILGLTDADTPIAGVAIGKIAGLPARMAEEMDLRHDVTGPAECYVNEPPLIVPPAGRTEVEEVAGMVPEATNDYGFTTENRFYELTWAFCIGGRIGPLAEPAVVELITTANAAQIHVTMFAEDGVTFAESDTPFYSTRPHPLAFEGLRKVLFFNSNIDVTTGLRKGLPAWRRVTARQYLGASQTPGDSFPLTVVDTEHAVAITQPHQLSPGNPRLDRDPDGVHPQVRLYPRPTTADATYPQDEIASGHTAPVVEFKQSLCRYLARPPKLAEPSDSPAMPTEFHQVIVWKAAATMLRRCGDPKMAADYEERATEKMLSMVNAHTHRVDTNFVRGQWSYVNGRLMPVVTFTRVG